MQALAKLLVVFSCLVWGTSYASNSSVPPVGCIPVATYKQNNIYEVIGASNNKAWLHTEDGSKWDGCLSLSNCRWPMENVHTLMPSMKAFTSSEYSNTIRYNPTSGYYSTKYNHPTFDNQLNTISRLLSETVSQSCQLVDWSQKKVLFADLGGSKFLIFRLSVESSCLEAFVRQSDGSSVLSIGTSCSADIKSKAQKFDSELLTGNSMMWITTSDIDRKVSIQLTDNGSELEGTNIKTFGISSPTYTKKWLNNIIAASSLDLKLDIKDDPIPSERSDTPVKKLFHWLAAASVRIELSRSDPRAIAARRWFAETAKQGDIVNKSTHFRVEKVN